MAGSGPETISTLSGPQRQIAKQLSGILGTGLSNGVQGIQGDLIAGLIPELQLVKQLGLQGTSSPYDSSTQNAVLNMLAGQTANSLDPQTTQRAFQDAVVRPSMQMFDEQVAPRIAANYAGVGQTFSTRRGLASQNALTDLQSSLTGQLSNMFRQDEQLRMQLGEQARQYGVASAQQLAMQPFQRAGALAGVLSPFQQYEDQLVQARNNEFLRTQAENNPYLQYALGFTGQNHTQVVPGSGSPLGAIGASLGGLVGLMNPTMFGLEGLQAATGLSAIGGGLGGALGGIR